MQTTEVKPDRTLLVIVSIIAAMVVLALVVVFSRGAPAPLDPSTPQGVVQTYSNAVVAGDLPAAKSLLTDDLRENCDGVDSSMVTDLRLTLISSTINGDNAKVRVAISSNPGGGAFGGSSYETEDAFILERVAGGNWKIDNAPWPLTICYKMEG